MRLGETMMSLPSSLSLERVIVCPYRTERVTES